MKQRSNNESNTKSNLNPKGKTFLGKWEVGSGMGVGRRAGEHFQGYAFVRFASP